MQRNEDLTGMYHRLLSPRIPVLVVSNRNDNRPNVMACAWHTPVSMNPPILSVCIMQKRMTHRLIEENGDFTLNIPGRELLDRVKEAGSKSGWNHDKSSLFKYAPAIKTKSPVISESIGVIECTLNRMIEVGDHAVIFGNVVSAYAAGFDQVWRGNYPLLHLGADNYM
uniref:Flavin reductase family protein n=1 Tax=Candidatus Methanomethylicus mesodigestus TaxID=1867258 RepID=A0A7C3IWS2_9CREN